MTDNKIKRRVRSRHGVPQKHDRPTGCRTAVAFVFTRPGPVAAAAANTCIMRDIRVCHFSFYGTVVRVCERRKEKKIPNCAPAKRPSLPLSPLRLFCSLYLRSPPTSSLIPPVVRSYRSLHRAQPNRGRPCATERRTRRAVIFYGGRACGRTDNTCV